MEAHRLDLVARLSAACGTEVAEHDPDAVVAWPGIPTVAAMAEHLGAVHRWVTTVLRTRSAAAQTAVAAPPGEGLLPWFAEGRAALLDALTDVAPDEPCWVLGRGPGTAAFWRRRMVFEHAKHLIDLRAADGGAWRAAPELSPEDSADGVDELVEVFLPRTRRHLPPLPGAVVLRATDAPRTWRFGTDWAVDDGTDGAARVRGPAGDLALLLWERADLLAPGSALRVEGRRAAAVALAATSIHPW